MKIALVRVPESATPRLAVACDGALYDVAELDAGPGAGRGLPTDFHVRVVGLACAGLHDVVEQLRSGLRPSRARLGPCDVLLLPPCDVERAHACQIGPADGATPHPVFRLLDARGLGADGQSVAFPAGATHAEVEASIAAVIGEDLSCATEAEASRAVLGYTLMLEWGTWPPDRPWVERRLWDYVAVQLGPLLVTSDEIGRPEELAVRVTLAEQSWPAGPLGAGAFTMAESISFLSRHVQLRAGDVVGLGVLRNARASGGHIFDGTATPHTKHPGAGRSTYEPSALWEGAWFSIEAPPLGPLRGRARMCRRDTRGPSARPARP